MACVPALFDTQAQSQSLRHAGGSHQSLLRAESNGALMNHQEYTFARHALIGGSHVVIATIPLSEQRIRIVQLRTKGGQYQGKYINDNKWYPVLCVEIQS